MNKYFVECNIRTGEGPDLWVHVAPTDGRPMEFTQEGMAELFMAELDAGDTALDYRVSSRPETLGEALESITKNHTPEELRRFVGFVNSQG